MHDKGKSMKNKHVYFSSEIYKSHIRDFKKNLNIVYDFFRFIIKNNCKKTWKLNIKDYTQTKKIAKSSYWYEEL